MTKEAKICPSCGGSTKCMMCGGSGKDPASSQRRYSGDFGLQVGSPTTAMKACSKCHGTGTCPVCHGSGKVKPKE
jgi:hypothetical protein